MQPDSNFSYIAPEDPSDTPQLPFPEPGQPSPSPSTIPSMPELSVGPDSLQLPFPDRAADAYTSTQIPFPQPLPSTETIDTTQIRFLERQPMTEMDETSKSAQMPLPQQAPLNETGTYIQNPSPPQISSATPYMQPSQPGAGYQASALMPGLVEIPFATQTMPALVTAEESQPPAPLAPSNQDAKRAIINGVISFVVSIFTLATIAGVAALVIGTFAIIYGLLGLRLARRQPNRAGRGQALIGIALGLIAWSIVIAAFILRAPHSS